MKPLYQAIQALFKQPEAIRAFTGQNLRIPEFIDLYDGQPEEPDRFEFTTPALFVDYSIDWERAGTMRKGKLTLEVHVLTDPTDETDNLSGPLSGMEKVDYYETVSDLLEDLATCETSGLVLTGERPVTTDYFNYHLLTFTCTISRRRTQVTHGGIDEISINSPTPNKYIID
ncbi:hypothetical protein [Bacteroides sp.]